MDMQDNTLAGPRARTAAGSMAIGGIVACLALIAPAAAGDWTQFYIGAGIGADAVTGKVEAADDFGNAVRAEGMGGGDIGLTLRLGADYQMNNWLVLGAFANFDWSNIETTASVTDGVDSASAKLMKLNYAWAIGGRAGVLVTPSVMVYGLLGYTRVDLDDPSVTFGGNTYSLELPSYDGVVFGGGFEHKLTNNVSLTGEYRQSRFDSAVLFANPDVTIRGEPTLHVGRIGVAYRFGGAAEAPAPYGGSAEASSRWTGFYLAAGFGADALTRDLSLDIPGLNVSAALDGLGGGDIGGTVTAGYDRLIDGRYLLGIFGSYDFSGHETEVSANVFGTTASIDLLSLDRGWSIGGRAGLLLADDVLAYGLLGYTHVAFADISFAGGGLSGGFAFPEFSGVVLGAGFEKSFGSGFSLRAEYRVSLLDEESVSAIPGVVSLDMDPTIHTARILLSYKFGASD